MPFVTFISSVIPCVSYAETFEDVV